MEDLFNPSETSRLNLNLVKVLDKTNDEDKEQIFRLFPESRDDFTELLRVREQATWDSVKQTPFLDEKFSDRDAFPVDDADVDVGRRFRQLQREFLGLLKTLRKFEFCDDGFEKFCRSFELIDFVVEKRTEVNELLEHACDARTLDSTGSFHSLLEVLADLNRFCPSEIWRSERDLLAAKMLGLLPASTETGKHHPLISYIHLGAINIELRSFVSRKTKPTSL